MIENYIGEEQDVKRRVLFYVRRKKLQIPREYQKFPFLVEDVASLLEELVVIFLIIVGIFNKRALEHQLILEIFKLK